jgi:hypothetical protein
MPCRGSSITAYKDTICELAEIVTKYADHDIILGGDWNGSIHRAPRDKHDKTLLDFLNNSELLLPMGKDYPTQPTFNPSYNNHSSLIDYFLVSVMNVSKINNVQVLVDMPCSDSPHSPVSAGTNISIPRAVPKTLDTDMKSRPRWNKGDIASYADSVKLCVQNILPLLEPVSALSTSLVLVRLIQGIQRAEQHNIPRPKIPKSRMKPKPLPVMEAIRESKRAFHEWKAALADQLPARAATLKCSSQREIYDPRRGSFRPWHVRNFTTI